MNPRHLSLSAERYTPTDIVERSERVLGGFDFDPASCEKANQVVRAARFYTAEDNGLEQEWRGRGFINPPGTCKELVRVEEGKGVYSFPGCGDELATIDPKTGAPKKRKTCSCNFVPRFWHKLLYHVNRGDVPAAIWIGFNCSQLQSLQSKPLSPLHFLTCFPSERLAYLGPDLRPLTAPPHNSYVTLVAPPGSPLEARFAYEFDDLGIITRKY